jgi:hypothetical protein
MTTPAMTDHQLIDYSGEHLLHELSMLWELAQILPNRKPSTETSALIESFGIHLRNLVDFFYRKGHGDDVTARDFVDQTTSWNPTEPSSLTSAHQRANKELSHLTQKRLSGNPPEKAWATAVLLREIDAVAREFAAKASVKKLHPKVREFLQLPPEKMFAWIGENVSHINIDIPIVMSVSAQSTQTQLVPKVEQIVSPCPAPKKAD